MSVPVAAIPQPVPLADLPQGGSGIIAAMGLDPEDAALLRAMGLCPNATVRIIRAGFPCVVAVGGADHASCACGGMCRIGLAPGLAAKITVRPGTQD